MLSAACAFAAGTLLAFYVQLPALPVLALGIAAMAGLRLLGFGARPAAGRALWPIAIALAALGLATLRTADTRRGGLLHQATESRERIEITGMIALPPELHSYSDLEPPMHTVTLRLESVRRTKEPDRAHATVRVIVRDPDRRWSPAYGDIIRLTGNLEPHPQLSFAAHGNAYRIRAEADGVERLASGQGSPLLAACWRLRERCAELLARGLETRPDHAGVLHALLLGYRESLPRPYHDTFAATGMLHVFAVSGLHVGILGVVALGFIRLAGVSRPRWFLALAPILILYTILIGLKTSAVRACVMALCLWMAPAWSRRPDALSSLGLAALLVLLAEPRQIGDVGFIFSFAIVAGLILLYPPVYARLARLLPAPDPWAPQPGRLRKAGAAAQRYALGLAAASIAAWIVSAPLTAYFFNRFSPIGLLGNLVVIPSAFIVVALGCLTVVAGMIFPPLGNLFAVPNRFAVAFLLDWVEGMAGIPGGHRFVPPPPATALVLFYAGLLAWMRLGQRGRWRMGFAA